jgi:hypothetical protein
MINEEYVLVLIYCEGGSALVGKMGIVDPAAARMQPEGIGR